MTRIILVFIVFSLFSCNRLEKEINRNLDSEQVHESSTIFKFSDGYEFFAEYNPLISDEQSEFLVHLTDLSTYKPVSEGRISVLLKGTGGELKATSDHPIRPGIYEIALTPANPGVHSITILFELNEIKESIMDSIVVFPDEETMEQSIIQEHKEGITFLKEQAWQTDFMVEEIKLRSFHQVIPVSGEILAVPGKKQNIPATVDGMVVFARNNLVPGSSVKRGETLFHITSDGLVNNNISVRYKEAMIQYNKSKSEYQRHAMLFQQEVISEKTFIESRTRYLMDSTEYFLIENTITKKGSEIRALEAGYIHELNVSEGAFVTVGTNLAVVSDNKNLMLRCDIPQQYYSHIDHIETVNFRTAYSQQVYSAEDLSGRLLARGSSVAMNNHFLPIYFELTNNGTLIEGAYAECYLKASPTEQATVIPLDALVEELSRYYAYIHIDGELFERLEIETGSTDGKYIEVLKGIQPGNRIVTKGTMLIKAASIAAGGAADTHSH